VAGGIIGLLRIARVRNAPASRPGRADGEKETLIDSCCSNAVFRLFYRMCGVTVIKVCFFSPYLL